MKLEIDILSLIIGISHKTHISRATLCPRSSPSLILRISYVHDVLAFVLNVLHVYISCTVCELPYREINHPAKGS